MRRRKVSIVSGIQIIDNPRVVKEADALAEMGFEVEVYAAINSSESLARIERLLAGRRWAHKLVIDRTTSSWRGVLNNCVARVSSRVWREIGLRLGVENQRQLGEATMVLCGAALDSQADLYSLHVDAALWTGKVLADRGLPFSIDIEDWYSEDGLPADRVARPIQLMKRLERRLLNNAAYATTTSEAMAKALVEEYGCPPLDVIYNSFPCEDRTKTDGRFVDRKCLSSPSIIWFSQTIGPGRGIEQLFAALSDIESEFQVHLRGTPRPGYLEKLLSGCSKTLRQRIYVHRQVPQEELLSRLMEHDIGYCGELSDCRSRDLTITNKIMEYMRAGLATVASSTSGQREVAAKAPGAVNLFDQGDVGALARTLRLLIESDGHLRASKQAAWKGFDRAFGWDSSKRRIQANVERFFERPVRVGV